MPHFSCLPLFLDRGLQLLPGVEDEDGAALG